MRLPLYRGFFEAPRTVETACSLVAATKHEGGGAGESIRA
jgi:hypothetical protein